MTASARWIVAAGLPLLMGLVPRGDAAAQHDSVPAWLRDRDTGIALSQFGSYVRRGELVVYPYYEYYRDRDYEYKPAELGFGLDRDFRGRYRAHEALLFLAYGLSDRVALEFEAAVITATLHTAPGDTSGVPPRLQESGIGDVEGQVRVRWMRESASRPELFSYFEAVAPLQRRRRLIGTQDWELKAGLGLTRGFGVGTMTLRLSGEYAADEGTVDLGEYAIEHLRRWSPRWRTYLAIEGTQDEVELITEAQWHVSRHVIIKLNSAYGLTSKATGWAPEIGVMFTLPLRR
jgi:hypothetical protein